MSFVKNNTKKGSRFNARGKASYARTPRFKLYKTPMQRVKVFTTKTDAAASLSNWIRDSTFEYFGYGCPLEGIGAYDKTPVNDPSGAFAKGALMFIDGTSLRIPRFLGGNAVATGAQAAKPLFSRLSDTANILNVNVTRTIFNQTSARFTVRTFIFQNTGKSSPLFGWNLPFSAGGGSWRPWGTSPAVYARIGFQFGGCPTVYNQDICLSGIRSNPVNLFCDKSGTRLTTISSDEETVVSGIRLDPDILDRKGDFYADNLVAVPPRREVTYPATIDGEIFRNENLAVGSRAGYIVDHVNDGSATKVDHFTLKMNKRLDYEDDGENVTVKQGDLLIVHVVVPCYEPCLDRESGSTLQAPVNVMNIFSEIQITTEVAVNFTDGT